MNILVMYQSKINCILKTDASLLVDIKRLENSTDFLGTEFSRNFFKDFFELMNGESRVNFPLSHSNCNVGEFQIFLFKNPINFTQLFSSVVIHVHEN